MTKVCVGECRAFILFFFPALSSFFLLPAAYGTPQAGAQGYTQPAQAYGTSGYANTAATPPATQGSYGTQPGYTAQSAYSGYSQQATSAPQRYSGASFVCCCVGAVPLIVWKKLSGMFVSSYSAGTQPAYAQSGYQAQQPAYGGQQQATYAQGASQQPPPSTAYPPPSNGSYSQPQYSQPGAPQSSYDQSGPYSEWLSSDLSLSEVMALFTKHTWLLATFSKHT